MTPFQIAGVELTPEAIAMYNAAPRDSVVRTRQIVMELTKVAPARFMKYKPNGFRCDYGMDHIEVFVSNLKSRMTMVHVYEHKGRQRPQTLHGRIDDQLWSGGWLFKKSKGSDFTDSREFHIFVVSGKR